MCLWICLFVSLIDGLLGTFTTNPSPTGFGCTGSDLQLTWEYSTPNDPLYVQWKKEGTSFLNWNINANSYSHPSTFDSSTVTHDNANGQITIKGLNSSYSGTYSCEMTDSSGTISSSKSHILQVYDLLTSSINCSCDTNRINCNLPSSITQVTINNTQENLPFTPVVEGSYVVCMIGDQTNCRENNVDICDTVDLCPTGGSSTDGKSCHAATFCLVIWFNLRFHKIGKVVLIIIGVVVDLLFEITLLWGVEYGSDFKLFKSDINCRVVRIGVICHVVAVVIEIVKVVVQYLYIEELGARMLVCRRPDGKIKEVRKSDVEEHPSRDGRKGPSADNQSKTLAKPEDIMLFVHFTVPLGNTVNKLVTEEHASIENNPKYVSNDRGTLFIKSATERDNGIYQGILTSDGNEKRVNAVLHVSGTRPQSIRRANF